MSIIEKSNITNYIAEYTGNFQAGNTPKTSKTVEYFNSLYSYPPKIKVKWNGVDELKNDRFFKYNYDVVQQNFPFIDFVEDWFLETADTPQDAQTTQYKISHYLDGYLDKLNSSKFYSRQTKDIQNSLANVPIYTILNGRGDTDLSTNQSDHLRS